MMVYIVVRDDEIYGVYDTVEKAQAEIAPPKQVYDPLLQKWRTVTDNAYYTNCFVE